MTKTCKYLIVGDNIIVHTPKGLISINKSHSGYDRIKEHLKTRHYDRALRLIDKSENVNKSSGGRIKIKDGVAYIDGEALPNALSVYVKELIESNQSLVPVTRFWQNLKQNPDPWEKEHPGEGVRENLFKFLQTKGIQLTKDGCFVAYKYVNEDYLDSHTRTFDNHPGKKVSMPRDKCDHNPNSSCSTGLHVGAWDYVKNSGEHIMEVKVHPKDVVSVPYHYDCHKMRTCGYEVLGEYGVKDDPLSGRLHDNKRTYYYHGISTNDVPFNAKNVTSHKPPSHWVHTFRARNTKEAVRKFRVLHKKYNG